MIMRRLSAIRSRAVHRFRTAALPIALLLACSVPAAAQVVFDSASNASPATVSAANPTAVSWNHTVSLVKKPYITAGISIKLGGGTATVTTVFYGTEAGGPVQPMTRLGFQNNGANVRAELWGLAGPVAGTHQITVTIANPGGQQMAIVAGSKSFTNVFQTAASGAAVGAALTTTTPTVTTANAPYDYVVDAVSYNANQALTPGAGQVVNSYNLTSALPAFAGAGSCETGASNTTMSWTASGAAAAWATIAVPLHPANPQILFDAASQSAPTNLGTGGTVVWNHTTTTAANRYLVVGVSMRLNNFAPGAALGIAGVTYGAQAMTAIPNTIALIGNQIRTELYGLVAPASGTAAITVTITNTNNRALTIEAGGQSFSNVDQTVPFTAGTGVNATGNSQTPTINVTNSPYDYVVDTVGFQANVAMSPLSSVLPAPPIQDQRWGSNINGPNLGSGGSGVRGYQNVTLTWTQGGGATQNWGMSAIPLKQVTVGLKKTASADVIKLGTTVTYTMTATNYTPATINGVTINDAIPAGTVFVSTTGCTGAGPISCTIGALTAGATSAPVTLTVRATGAGTFTNTATVTYTGATLPNSSESIRVAAETKICATPGKDLAGATLVGVKNDYWIGTLAPAAGAVQLTVGARNGAGLGKDIQDGDLLIIMQMQDAAFDTTNDETYGEGTGSTRATGTGSGAATTLNNAGRWEYVVAANNGVTTIGAGGGLVKFSGGGAGGGLLYNYTSQTFAASTTQGQRSYQVIRVPQYTTATLGTGLTAAPWNGATGGVLAIDVAGTLDMGGGATTVSVDGLGFRGGGGIKMTGDAVTVGLAFTDFRTLAPDSATAPTVRTVNGAKGEGIAGTPKWVYRHGANIGLPASGNFALDTLAEGYVGGSFGRGAPGNAGGGSTDGVPTVNGDNSGGGGGGNGGFGGAGGNSWNSNLGIGGQGGGGISPSLTRITMGGGGGAGTTNNGSAETCIAPPTCRANVAGDWTDTEAGTNGYYSSGANGGGVIIMRAMQAINTATLTANGFNAYNVGRDGGGGGGAGGSILFTTQTGDLAGVTTQVKGGNGGNAWLTTAPGAAPTERHGPGGGGGGGYVLLSSNTAPAPDVSAGVNGLTTTINDNYGAQPGTAGVVEYIAGNNVLPGGDGATCAIVDLSVTNTDTPDPVNASQNITYTQVVTNNGPSFADTVTLTTFVPASTTFVSMTPPGPAWVCTSPAAGASTGLIRCVNSSGMISGTSASFTFIAKTEAGTPPGYTISDTANVTTLSTESNYANNTATATTVVTDLGSADMRVVITAPATVVANTNIVYAQTVTNGGGLAAANPSFTENTPPNTTFVSVTPPAGWSCPTQPAPGGTGTIICNSATPLGVGASISIPMTVKVNAGTVAGTVITENASVSSTTIDLYLANNTSSASTTVVAANTADVAVTMSVSPTQVGQTGEFVQFTDVVTNNGVVATNATFFNHQVPANTTFVSITAPAGWTCTPPVVGSAAGTLIPCSTSATMAVGASVSFVEKFQVLAGTAAATVITNSLQINVAAPPAGVTDSNLANNTASATTTVRAAGNADLSIVKTDSPDPVGEGQLVTYLLTVVNNGPEIATGVSISDTLPVSMLYQSVSASQTVPPGCTGTTTINCSLGTLAINGSATVTITVQATAIGTISNTATVSGTKTDPVAANNSSTTSTTVLSVTLIKLRDFTATQDGKKVTLAWQTSFEQDNLGFNVYREISGKRTKVNKSLIAGSALLTKKQDPSAGYVYRLKDKVESASAYVQYYLEDIDLAGVHTMHGPYLPIFGSQTDGADSPPLAGLGQGGTVIASPAGLGVIHDITLPKPSNQQINKQFDLAGQSTLKIYVTDEGWYRITKAAIVAAGFDPGTDPKELSLWSAGLEQPLLVDDGGDNKFDTTDAVEFYGFGVDTQWTGARTYWLRAKSGSKRITLQKDKGADAGVKSVAFTYERKERGIYFAASTANPEGQNFFGPVVFSEPTTQDLAVASLDTTYSGNASIVIAIQGGTDGAHLMSFAINGHNLGTASLRGQDQATRTFTFPNSYLINGTNALTMQSFANAEDASALVLTQLTYRHLLRADEGAFEATVPGGVSINVGGFTSNKIRALDVTDPLKPTELQVVASADPLGGFIGSCTPLSGASRVVLLAQDTRILAPPEMSFNKPSAYNATNGKSGADLLIITNKAFLSAAATLQPVREAEGTTTLLIDVEDLYDEFNFGIRDPQAIRTFIDYAKKYKTDPKYVLLVGDASIDPRNYEQLGLFDYVPTKQVATTLMMSASDDWLTDLDGDGIADVAIGRIPVDTLAEANVVFNKLTSRGKPTGTWSTSALFIADRPTDFDFAQVTRMLTTMVPAGFNTQTVDLTKTSSANSAITTALNQGQLIVDYVGHGSQEVWSNLSTWGSADAAALSNNPRLPFVITMTCLNGYFADTYAGSLAEALLKAPNGGAIAVWASSTLTEPASQALMNTELFRQLFGSAKTIGEATMKAKRVVGDKDVKKSWILFGDPSMKLR
jgi:uncharacterized repeat protein (TIGR01451 family)